jgi:PAS domain S-box-containing protein
MINPAVTELLGYSPEQLLGQPLASLVAADDDDGAAKLEQQMKLMADRQSAATYEGHVTCLTDDDTEIPCLLNLLALFHGDDVSAFVAILRDESALLQQQQEAEVAKRQSETLLYQILPRDIVVRLNAGEKDISFSIPSVTIMFIDIQKFSDYAANLTPQDIMGNLSLIFQAFDEACAKYALLLKIKLIGDVYMCAGGLFTPDVQPNTHAEAMARFAIDALQIIEDVNVKLNSALAIRIGINSGGPILAGVLGTDRPTFDIIGDSINVAARLQSTDVAGRIQISASTQELLAGFEFQIEYRGEIELKGKGKMKTFFLDPTPPQQITVSISQSTLEDIARFMPPP